MAMTEDQCLLLILAEECAEVSQRVTKSLRFGLSNIQDGQPLDNTARLEGEINDLLALLEMLWSRDVISRDKCLDRNAIYEKWRRVHKYMDLSKSLQMVKD